MHEAKMLLETKKSSGTDLRVRLHPGRQEWRYPEADHRDHHTEEQNETAPQRGKAFHLIPVAASVSLRQQGKQSDRETAGEGMNQPVYRSAGADRSGRGRTQMPHHSRIDILQDRTEHLLYNGWQGQAYQRLQRLFSAAARKIRLCRSKIISQKFLGYIKRSCVILA